MRKNSFVHIYRGLSFFFPWFPISHTHDYHSTKCYIERVYCLMAMQQYRKLAHIQHINYAQSSQCYKLSSHACWMVIWFKFRKRETVFPKIKRNVIIDSCLIKLSICQRFLRANFIQSIIHCDPILLKNVRTLNFLDWLYQHSLSRAIAF
jgi:hypothetical protein